MKTLLILLSLLFLHTEPDLEGIVKDLQEELQTDAPMLIDCYAFDDSETVGITEVDGKKYFFTHRIINGEKRKTIRPVLQNEDCDDIKYYAEMRDMTFKNP